MTLITVYTKNNCPYCDRAKALLDSRGVSYDTINLEETPSARNFLVEQGLRSVPQIFNNSTLVPGGFQGLASQPDEFWTQFQGQ
jgi:glutaredoxin